MLRRISIVGLLAIALTGAWFAAGRLAVPPACPNCDVYIISLDQVRADSIGCFGYAKDTMPELCRFAASASMFTEAYSVASRTLDAHFSVMTGLYPSGHRMNIPYASVLPDGIQTVAEVFRNNGYRTVFMGPSGDPHLPLTRGMERGFDEMITADEPELWEEAIAKTASVTGTPRKSMYFLHTYAAHEPFMPRPETVQRFYDGESIQMMSAEDICKFTFERITEVRPQISGMMTGSTYCDRVGWYQEHFSQSKEEYDHTYALFNDRYWAQFDGLSPGVKREFTHALYAASLNELDARLGKFIGFLRANGSLERSIIIIIGDQGDEFGEHGGWSHGGTLYREVLRVPFIVYVPGNTPVRRGGLASLVDVFPAAVYAAGMTVPHGIHGVNLLRDSHDYVFSEHVSDGLWSVRTDRYTYIRGDGTEELYDRGNDPDEMNNIASDAPGIVERMRGLYKDFRTRTASASDTNDFPSWMDTEMRRRLIETGYF